MPLDDYYTQIEAYQNLISQSVGLPMTYAESGPVAYKEENSWQYSAAVDTMKATWWNQAFLNHPTITGKRGWITQEALVKTTVEFVGQGTTIKCPGGHKYKILEEDQMKMAYYVQKLE